MSKNPPKTIEQPVVDGILERLARSLQNESNNYDGTEAARHVDALIRERIADPGGKRTERVDNPAHPDNQDSFGDEEGFDD